MEQTSQRRVVTSANKMPWNRRITTSREIITRRARDAESTTSRCCKDPTEGTQGGINERSFEQRLDEKYGRIRDSNNSIDDKSRIAEHAGWAVPLVQIEFEKEAEFCSKCVEAIT